MRPSVILTDSDLGDRAFESKLLTSTIGADVFVAECSTEEDLLGLLDHMQPDAIVTQWCPVGAKVIAKLEHCQVISRIGIGIDMIDTEAATAHGVAVRNVPHYCSEEVASHAVALALALHRRVPQLDAELRTGTWGAAAHSDRIHRLSGLTVGLVGAGTIGRLVGRAFAIWGCEIIAVDPFGGDDSYERVDLDELAMRADIISLHAPLTSENHHLLDEKFFKMAASRTPIIVNTSRGPLIDTRALASALRENQIAGAGLDVFESEPLAQDHPLRSAPNTLLTPHAAWCSADALVELRRGAIENVIEVLTESMGVTRGIE